MEREQAAWNYIIGIIKEQHVSIFEFVETNVECSPLLYNKCMQILRKKNQAPQIVDAHKRHKNSMSLYARWDMHGSSQKMEIKS